MTEQARGQQGANVKLLVVDDDRVTRKLLVRYLEKSGYEVIESENGHQCLAMFDAHRPQMVLLDVMMPEMDGFETCQALRQRVPDQALPILMLTGREDVAAVSEAFECGATDFIAKPYNWPLLIQRVRFALRDRAIYFDLQEKQKRLEEAQRIAKMGFGRMNLVTGQVDISREIAHILELGETTQLATDQFYGFLDAEDQQRMRQAIEGAVAAGGQYSLVHRVTLPSGKEKVIQQRGEIRTIDGQAVVYGTLQDVTEQALAEERIRYHTYYDLLTELPNRTFFEKQLAEVLQAEDHCVLFFIGIDRFKVINDTIGHHKGDELLKAIARRLQRLQHGETHLARFGSDHFAFLMSGAMSEERIDEIALEIIERIGWPLKVNSNEFVLSASVGIALYPQEATCLDDLLKGADAAMNHAANDGGGRFHYFSTTMDTRAQERLRLEQELRQALKLHQLEVFYQPQFDANNREVVGMEALVRWRHPERGLILPDIFIPLAEETDLVVELGEWVLREAVRQTAHWHRLHRGLRLGVNLSAKQLALANIVDLVAEVVNANGLDPACLELEITESMAVRDFDNTILTLERLHAIGVRTSMDDFGTGYSSLNYLKQLPLNTLKVDRAFIKDIANDGRGGEIARGIVALAKSLSLYVIAEGIETQTQYEHLRAYGADEIQGFLFSKPLPADEFEQLIVANQVS